MKEELSQLETQKKGLEAILRKCNSGKCKVVKEEGEVTAFKENRKKTKFSFDFLGDK